ncbi:MAG: aspartate aminotransferase family protein [Candidatus Latescibacteria bacterium]|nr:aspartate aminotransferase family protein [Candidatus Latescibacterota bacterium]
MNWNRSKELFKRAQASLAGGVSSQFRVGGYPHPLFFERGEGARICDVDGNEYIDYILGQGPAILGYAPKFLVDAVAASLGRGQVFAGQIELEVTVSETIQRVVPCADLVRYANSGSEVVHTALRLARGMTGREKIIKFEGHYHGWLDNIAVSLNPTLEQAGPYETPNVVPLTKGQEKAVLQDIIVLPWNNLEVFKRAIQRHRGEIAGVIMEAIMCNTNCILPGPGYLEGVRELCSGERILLIFDEVITGFRVDIGGAQKYLGVTPDVAVFGKAMGGGFPISMVAGKREFMEKVADGTILHAGTLNANVPSMTAVAVSLEKLEENDGAIYHHLFRVGHLLMDGIRERAKRHGIDVLIQGPGPLFHLGLTTAREVTDYRSHLTHCDMKRYAKFVALMLENGVRLVGRGMWYISAAHGEREVEETLRAVDQAFGKL